MLYHWDQYHKQSNKQWDKIQEVEVQKKNQIAGNHLIKNLKNY